MSTIALCQDQRLGALASYDVEMCRQEFIRVDWLYRFGVALTEGAWGSFYDVKMRNLDYLKGLNGFVALPKHSSTADIPLVGQALHRGDHRMAYFFMKSSLPMVHNLRYLGGIIAHRKKEMKKLYGNDKDGLELAMAAERRRIDDLMAYGLDRGEVLVDFIEGARRARRPFEPRDDLIDRLVLVQTSSDPTFVPIWLDYEFLNLYGSRVTLTVGEPLTTRDPQLLKNHLLSFKH